MSVQQLVFTLSIPASGDLSASQFRLVKIDSNGQLAVAGAGEDAVGVLGNKPDAQGKVGELQIGALLKAEAGADLAPGTKVTSDASGKLAAAGIGDHVFGTLIGDPAADGDVVEVLVHSNHILA